MKIKVSDYIFKFLKSKNIDTAFMFSGGAAAHLLESARKSGINYVANLHEQACTMAADSYYRIARKPALVLVTNGPGSSNAITGVLGAYQDSIPMIVVSGQVTLNNLMLGLNIRQLGVQESDVISLVKPITKYAVCVTNPKDIRHHLEHAYDLAMSGRMGPVWLDIPLDIQSAVVEEDDLKPYYNEKTIETERSYSNIIYALFESKKPVIIAGNGIHLSHTERYFKQLIDILNIPVISTWNAKDLMDYDDDRYIGNSGILGERAANFAVQNSDFLLILGSRMSIPQIGYKFELFSPKSKKVMVDVDMYEINKPTIKIDLPVCKKLENFLPEFISQIRTVKIPDKWEDWNKKTLLWKEKYSIFPKKQEENADKINSFYFMEVLGKNLHPEHIIVTDMGTSFTCTMQSLKVKKTNRLYTSSACASMGFGLPGAIGACIASGRKDVVCIAGDGGLQLNIQELQTIIHYNLPIKVFLLNNKGYLAISLMQDNLFDGHYMASTPETGVGFPDFSKVAQAYGYKTYKLENNEQLENSISSILSEPGPIFCEVMMPEHQLLIPRVQSSKDENGKIISTSLENMFPYLSDEEMKGIME